jgi:LacI family transcriptional regulator
VTVGDQVGSTPTAARAHHATPARVRLADVAAGAGVDRSIVSRILNDEAGLRVRDDTRARVLQVAKQLGYRPNTAARSLRTAQAGAVGLLVPDFRDPLYAEIIRGAEEAAGAHGHVVLTASSEGEKATLRRHLERISNGRVDGLVFAGSKVELTTTEMEGFQLPWLLLNRRTPRARRFVILDDVAAADAAVTHLIELGHQRIAYVTGPSWADTATRRRMGYEQALARAGIEVDEGLVTVSEYALEAGSRAVGEVLAKRGRGARATAIFADSWTIGAGVIHGLYAAGVRCPDEMSVVTIHDVPTSSHLCPPLTSVRMPMRELGRRGIELLLSTAPDEPIRETMPGGFELVVRESTARPGRAR